MKNSSRFEIGGTYHIVLTDNTIVSATYVGYDEGLWLFQDLYNHDGSLSTEVYGYAPKIFWNRIFLFQTDAENFCTS